MGITRGGGRLETEPIERDIENPEETVREFRGIRTAVHPEGDDAKVTIATTTGHLKLTVPFEYMAQANTEIRRAAILMLQRQTMRKDAGKTALEDLLATALCPRDISLAVDNETGDRLWVFQFDGHAPIVIRVSPEMGAEAAADLAQAIRRKAN